MIPGRDLQLLMMRYSDFQAKNLGKDGCDCCTNLKKKVIEFQRGEKLMKKKEIISLATAQREKEIQKPRIRDFGEMCMDSYLSMKSEKVSRFSGVGLQNALGEYRKLVF